MEIIQVSSREEFSELISTETIVDFSAEWCAPCRMIEETLKKVKLPVKVARVDIDELKEIAEEYGIQAVPTLIYFKDGKEVDRITGALNPKELGNWVKLVLGKREFSREKYVRRLREVANAHIDLGIDLLMFSAWVASNDVDMAAIKRKIERLPEVVRRVAEGVLDEVRVS